MIAEKIMKNVTDIHKVNRPLGHRFERGNCLVIVALWNMVDNHTTHKRAPIDHLMLRSMLEEKGRINEAIGHQVLRRGRCHFIIWGFLRPKNMSG